MSVHVHRAVTPPLSRIYPVTSSDTTPEDSRTSGDTDRSSTTSVPRNSQGGHPTSLTQLDGNFTTPPPCEVTSEVVQPPSTKVDQIFEFIVNYYIGNRPIDAADFQDFFKVSPSDFKVLRGRFEEQSWGCNIRYDYDSKESLFTFRMPTRYHDYVVKRVGQAIEEQLVNLVKELEQSNGNETVLSFARKVERIDGEFSIRKTSKCPDSTFQAHDQPPGGLVIEIKYSHNSKKLKKDVEKYLYRSRDQVVAVLTISLPHRECQAFNMSFYTVKKGVDEKGEPEEYIDEVTVHFHDEDGNEVEDPPGMINFDLNAFNPPDRLDYEATPIKLTRSDLRAWEAAASRVRDAAKGSGRKKGYPKRRKLTSDGEASDEYDPSSSTHVPPSDGHSTSISTTPDDASPASEKGQDGKRALISS